MHVEPRGAAGPARWSLTLLIRSPGGQGDEPGCKGAGTSEGPCIVNIMVFLEKNAAWGQITLVERFGIR